MSHGLQMYVFDRAYLNTYFHCYYGNVESMQSQNWLLTDSLTASGKTSLTSCANTPVSSPSQSLVSKPACSMYSRLYRYLYSFILDTLRSCSLVSTWKKSSINKSANKSISQSDQGFPVVWPGLPGFHRLTTNFTRNCSLQCWDLPRDLVGILAGVFASILLGSVLRFSRDLVGILSKT